MLYSITAFVIPRPNSILIPYSAGLNLIEGREHSLNRQLIYTSASIYLSFKKSSRSYRDIIRDTPPCGITL